MGVLIWWTQAVNQSSRSVTARLSSAARRSISARMAAMSFW